MCNNFGHKNTPLCLSVTKLTLHLLDFLSMHEDGFVLVETLSKSNPQFLQCVLGLPHGLFPVKDVQNVSLMRCLEGILARCEPPQVAPFNGGLVPPE